MSRALIHFTRSFVSLALLTATPAIRFAHAAEIADATGRTVTVPDHPARIVPLGPPAGVLLAALAPDLMVGWVHKPGPATLAWLPDQLAALPELPRLTPDNAAETLAGEHADLVLDYGDVTPRYADAIRAIQDNGHTPAILLDGQLAAAPGVLRALGRVLDRADRAELLARLVETTIADVQKPDPSPRVAYLHGSIDAPMIGKPGALQTEAFALAGWTVVAPATTDDKVPTFRPVTLDELTALDPDAIVFQDLKAADAAAASPEWRRLRAFRVRHAFAAPAMPFGWVDEPPSINRLFGLTWLTESPDGAPAVVTGTLLSALLFGKLPPAP